MKALIFAAGLGSRLKPLTDTMPKALVPVADKPLLEHLLLKMKRSGIEEVTINVHHFADQIISFLQKRNFGLTINISDERNCLLETGGGIKKAACFFNDKKPFLVHNVDVLSNADLQALYSKHEHNALATLLVSDRLSSRYLLFDNQNRLVGWTNVQTGEIKTPFDDLNIKECRRYAFSGIHVVSPDIFPLMQSWNGKFSIIDFYLSVAKLYCINCCHDSALKLLDVGKNDSLQQAEIFIKNDYLRK